MKNNKFTRRAALAVAAAAAIAAPAFAQQRIIRIVVPFGPGAVQDTVARTFNAEMGQILGASVIVENRPGAGGSVGTAYVAKSAPDGNTVVLAAASHTLAGHLYAKLPYDPIKDFVGVANIGTSGYAIAAPGNIGVNTLADYIKLVKSKPGQLNYASAGNGSATHLGMAFFLAKAGARCSTCR
jgi:tripartite-type tricarboxylate transporter receptor subunit TctC